MDVVIYARVSTGKQVENDLSIPDQLRQMREWCKAHHHRLVSEYVEAGATATDDRRPVFQQMIGEMRLSPLRRLKPSSSIASPGSSAMRWSSGSMSVSSKSPA